MSKLLREIKCRLKLKSKQKSKLKLTDLALQKAMVLLLAQDKRQLLLLPARTNTTLPCKKVKQIDNKQKLTEKMLMIKSKTLKVN